MVQVTETDWASIGTTIKKLEQRIKDLETTIRENLDFIDDQTAKESLRQILDSK